MLVKVAIVLCGAVLIDPSSGDERNRLELSGSCAQAKMCCDGKNATCVVDSNDYSDDYVANSAPCYCDHGCLDVGDCCPDFKDYCGVMDCRVGEWSSWSSCDVGCGTGSARRSRQVTHPVSNGGKPCPTLTQRKPCQGTKCSKRYRDKVSALRETAMLLPGKFVKDERRSYDVRSNLKSFQAKQLVKSQSYCTVFKVEKATPSCMRDRDTQSLFSGNTVCVKCQSRSVRGDLGDRCLGHGAEGKRTRFKNVLRHGCHGRWTRLQLLEGQDSCPCKEGKPDFAFL